LAFPSPRWQDPKLRRDATKLLKDIWEHSLLGPGWVIEAGPNDWLVVSNMAFIFHFMYGMSTFPLTDMFQDG
jgi:hypothetical protein